MCGALALHRRDSTNYWFIPPRVSRWRSQNTQYMIVYLNQKKCNHGLHFFARSRPGVQFRVIKILFFFSKPLQQLGKKTSGFDKINIKYEDTHHSIAGGDHRSKVKISTARHRENEDWHRRPVCILLDPPDSLQHLTRRTRKYLSGRRSWYELFILVFVKMIQTMISIINNTPDTMTILVNVVYA